ncbi:hypothetical protein EMCG_07775 [[Emmonsia] crescens]|uniref:HNH nuclease domain-containing protein n=1 Tax=[Emmonsia] crescens TaxID=73230 RepID=A0A0G2I8D4_9EURO|nr:hypothetical protein EMCG_07775 [Emmonsia crescens UAMH 3008]
MWIYDRDLGSSIKDPVNLVTLRADIHKYFDKRWFVVVPKIPGAGGPVQYVSHVLSVNAGEIWPKYHNVLVQYLDSESRPYLFARFAWAILLFARPFVTMGFPRQVIQLHVSTDADNVQVNWKAQFFSGEPLKSLYGEGGSKSAAPRKSRFVSESVADEDIESSETNDDTDNVWDNWESRNRRHQQISAETAPEEEVTFPKTGELAASVEREDVVFGVVE